MKSADQGDERAIHRLAAISAAAEGADPSQTTKGRRKRRESKVKGALGKLCFHRGPQQISKTDESSDFTVDADTKSKYFGIF